MVFDSKIAPKFLVITQVLFWASVVSARQLLDHEYSFSPAPEPSSDAFQLWDGEYSFSPAPAPSLDEVNLFDHEYSFSPAPGPSSSSSTSQFSLMRFDLFNAASGPSSDQDDAVLASGPTSDDKFWPSRNPVPAGVKLTGCTRPGLWALTFDDGPSTETTHKVLDALKENKIHATFFVKGDSVLQNEESKVVTLRALNEGHLIGSHSFSHPDFTQLNKTEMYAELKKSSDAIFEVTGEKPKYFRPPFGLLDEQVELVLKEQGYKIVMWNFDPLNVESRTESKKIFEAFEGTLEKSNPAEESVISVWSDEEPATAEVLMDLITIINDSGFKFVRADDCFNDNESPYW